MKSLLTCLSLATLALTSITAVASPLLVPAWKTDVVFEAPESVVFDAQQDVLYVSNVNGNPGDADGNGYISTLSLDGNVIKQHWLKGLNAPKGLALAGHLLYVADINELVVIDTKTHAIVQRYKAPEAKFLNDVAADEQGNVYVSDMMTNTIYRLHNDTFAAWLHDDALEQPNGLLVEGDKLIVGSWGVMTDGFATKVPGHLKTIDINSQKISSLGDNSPEGNLDGVEADGKGNYFVTDWIAGKLLHIEPNGHSTMMLDLEKGSADHTVLLDKNLIIIPMMLTGNVIAYEIKK